MERTLFLELVAFCQRQGVLSSTSEVTKELAEICGCDEQTIDEILD